MQARPRTKPGYVDFLTDRAAAARVARGVAMGERYALQQAHISFGTEALNQLTEGGQ
jgi:hypothetical protein